MVSVLHTKIALASRNTCPYNKRPVLHGDAYTLSRRKLLCSGKLSREITFTNFAVLWLFAKVFYVKFGGVASLAQHRRAISENHIFHQFAKVFSLESFPLYGNCQRFCYTSSSEVGNRVHETLLPYWDCYCQTVILEVQVTWEPHTVVSCSICSTVHTESGVRLQEWDSMQVWISDKLDSRVDYRPALSLRHGSSKRSGWSVDFGYTTFKYRIHGLISTTG